MNLWLGIVAFLELASGLGTLACLVAAVRVFRYFRRGSGNHGSALSGLSILVPIKGPYPPLAEHLSALVSLKLPFPCEFLFILESTGDPEFATCCRIREDHPGRDIFVLLSGPAGARMGKQHNLAHGLAHANHPCLAFMDMDVIPQVANFINGCRALQQDGVGVAFSLPNYLGEGPVGGRLVALYTHYFFNLFVGSLVAGGSPDFTIGSLWFATKAAIEHIGGLDQFTRVVSDDAAIGRAVKRAGMRNVLLPLPASIAVEQLDLPGGFRHLQKWVAMLRWQGLPSYLFILLAWHPVLWSLLALLIAAIAGLSPWNWIAVGLLATAVLARTLSMLGISASIPGERIAWRDLPMALAYEVLVVPLLFGIGLFKRDLVWRGKRYRIGRGGIILE